jgi:hypothetical protein
LGLRSILERSGRVEAAVEVEASVLEVKAVVEVETSVLEINAGVEVEVRQNSTSGELSRSRPVNVVTCKSTTK